MKTILVIGGMGAGKSTARKALVDQGLEFIDLDRVGHDILTWDVVKDDLREEFGDDVFNEDGSVNRPALAAKAFVTPATTRKLNRITQPRIEELFTEKLDELRKKGCQVVVVEYSVFKDRASSMAYAADVVLAVVAPIELRIKRAVQAGFSEEDVRHRIAKQITDADRIEQADVVFVNDTTKEELYNKVVQWWNDYKKQEGIEA